MTDAGRPSPRDRARPRSRACTSRSASSRSCAASTSRSPSTRSIALIGASGSGKSTLLRCINLIEPIDAGRILIEGDEITARGVDVDRIRRRVGHRVPGVQPVPAHVRAGQRHARAAQGARAASRADAERDALALLARFGLEAKAREFPDRLSGGQQQRVAIVRALAMGPDVLLLDEVTSRAGPGAGRRGAERDPRAGRGRHDDADRDPRDGLRARHREPGLLPRRGLDPGAGAAGRAVRARRARPGPASSSTGSSRRAGFSQGARRRSLPAGLQRGPPARSSSRAKSGCGGSDRTATIAGRHGSSPDRSMAERTARRDTGTVTARRCQRRLSVARLSGPRHASTKNANSRSNARGVDSVRSGWHWTPTRNAPARSRTPPPARRPGSATGPPPRTRRQVRGADRLVVVAVHGRPRRHRCWSG